MAINLVDRAIAQVPFFQSHTVEKPLSHEDFTGDKGKKKHFFWLCIFHIIKETHTVSRNKEKKNAPFAQG